MIITRLSIENFRIIRSATIEPSPGVNWFHGANGAGKTSVLEALCVLAKGRSFRSSTFGPIIGPEAESLRVVAATSEGTLGVQRWAKQWQGRVDSVDVRRVAEFAQRMPVVLFEPGSHALVEGSPAVRRQYLDWTLFHVEHDYLSRWRRCMRELQQRNAALRTGAHDELMGAFEQAFIVSAQRLDRSRRLLTETLAQALESTRAALGANFGPISVSYRSGWPRELSLEEAVRAARDTDRERGYTRYGPHRAELALLVDDQPAAQRLSRGQQKLLSLCLLLAQHGVLGQGQDQTPLLLLDDPLSELDEAHLARLWRWVEAQAGQTWVTALSPPNPDLGSNTRMFHVEHGCIRPD